MKYLLDTSALHRINLPPVRTAIAVLIESGRVYLCPAVELEWLYSAKNLAEYEVGVEKLKLGFPWVPMPEHAWERAQENNMP